MAADKKINDSLRGEAPPKAELLREFCFMTFLEKDLEEIIYNTKNELLQIRGLWIEGKKFRQLKIGNYGISDVITVNRNYEINRLSITIYELKKDAIGVSTFMQAVRYAKGIHSWLRKHKSFEYDLRFALVGKYIDFNTDLVYLPDIYENIELYTYEYEFDGIHFKPHRMYTLTNEGF